MMITIEIIRCYSFTSLEYAFHYLALSFTNIDKYKTRDGTVFPETLFLFWRADFNLR